MSKLNKILVTAAGPNMMPVLMKYSLPTFKRFASAQSYEVRVIALPQDDAARKSEAAKQARWGKIAIMRQALAEADLAVWFDADVLICRVDEDIVNSLGPDDYQGLVLHSVPAENRINPNTGVWALRRCETSLRFLDVVESIGMPAGRWSDQGAVMEALGWVKGDSQYYGARIPEDGSEYMPGTAWLPIGWNQPHCDNRPNPEAYAGRPTVPHPYAIHFMAMTIAERMMYMAPVAERILGMPSRTAQ